MHRFLSALLVLVLSSPATAADTIVYFTATYCGPCHRIKDLEFPKMANEGWAIVNFNDVVSGTRAHIIVVDMDEYPEFAKSYKVETIPQFYRVRGGIGSRLIGYQNAEAIKRFYNNK